MYVVFSSTNLPEGAWVVFRSWLLWFMLHYTRGRKQISEPLISFPRDSYPEWDSGHMVVVALIFLEWLHWVTSRPTMHPGALCSRSSPAFTFCLPMVTVPAGVRRHLTVVSRCISLMSRGAEHLFVRLLAPCGSSLQKCLYRSFAHFWNVICFLLPSCRSFFCVLYINNLSDTWFANIFSHSTGCLFVNIFFAI